MKANISSLKNRISLFTLLMGIGLFFSLSTNAQQTVIWSGPDAGDWATAANWIPVAPTATDSISIPAGKVVTVSTDAGMVNRLSVAGKLIIAASGTLTVDQAAYVLGGPIVNIIGGEIENNGTFTVKNSVTTASNTVIQFSDAATDNKFTNNGTFTLDNTIGAYASTVGRGIGLSQVTVGKVSTFKMGGTMNINIKPGCCFIESNGGGNLTIDGVTTIGSADSYKDFRFIKILNGGNVTTAATTNITFYSGFTNASNGVINVQSANTVVPGSSFTNNGRLSVHGGPATAGYGIYFNGQAASALNSININGNLYFEGTFPKGTMFIGGNGAAINTLNVSATGVLTLNNVDPAYVVLKSSAATTPFIINNEGIINLSSAAHALGTATVFTGVGLINYSYVGTGIKTITEFSGKVVAYGQTIEISLPANENAQMFLTDVTGRTIKTAFVQGEKNTITTNNLKGIYIVRLLTNKGSYSQKVSL
jgi:hypothetical protein